MTTWYINLFVLNKRLNEIRFVFDNIYFFKIIYLEIIKPEFIESKVRSPNSVRISPTRR